MVAITHREVSMLCKGYYPRMSCSGNGGHMTKRRQRRRKRRRKRRRQRRWWVDGCIRPDLDAG